jgi:glycolate oxidase FAD binding subunit
VVAEILFALPGRAFFDWGGGLIWLALAPVPDAGHAVVRGALRGTGGHATLIRADAEVRARVPVFQPQPAPLATLTRRIKDSFDPERVLNPGRMYKAI